MEENKLLKFLSLLIKPFVYMVFLFFILFLPLFPPEFLSYQDSFYLVIISFSFVVVFCFVIHKKSPENFRWILTAFVALFLCCVSIFLVPFIFDIVGGNLLLSIMLFVISLVIIFSILNGLHAEKLLYVLFVFLYIILFFYYM